MNATIAITKLDAARRQLRSAIELWFSDADFVAIHTLSAAAYQIIHDLNRRNKGPDLLLDTKFIKDEYRSEYVNEIKNASNFFKHADRGKMGLAKLFDFNPKSNEYFIFFAIFGLKYLGEKLAAEEIAFERWQMFQSPKLLTDAGKEQFKKDFTVEDIAAIRTIPKGQFLEAFRLVVRQSNAQ